MQISPILRSKWMIFSAQTTVKTTSFQIIITCLNWLIVYCLSSRSIICSALILRRNLKGSLLSHTFCHNRPRFLRFHPKNAPFTRLGGQLSGTEHKLRRLKLKIFITCEFTVLVKTDWSYTHSEHVSSVPFTMILQPS